MLVLCTNINTSVSRSRTGGIPICLYPLYHRRDNISIVCDQKEKRNLCDEGRTANGKKRSRYCQVQDHCRFGRQPLPLFLRRLRHCSLYDQAHPCGKQNVIGTKFCQDCGTKLPVAVQEEQMHADDHASVMSKRDKQLPQYPKWNCGGSHFEIEVYDGFTTFSVNFNGNTFRAK